MKDKNGNKYRKRKLPSGKIVYEVNIRGKWKSTGESSFERAQTAAKKRFFGQKNDTIISDFASDFYAPGGIQRKRLESRGKNRSTGYWLQQQSRLERYILPQIGDLKPCEVMPGMIDKLLTDIPLSGSIKNKILYSIKNILGEAVRRGLIDKNPCDEIEPFAETPQERKPFSVAELDLFFPSDIENLLRIWGGAMWAAYFTCLADCGHRPGEQSVLLWGDLWQFNGRAGFIIDKSMDGITLTAKGTTKTGYSRSTLLSERAYKILKLWHQQTPMPDDDDLIFTFDGRRGLIANTINKHLRLSAPRAGVDLQGRTAYCFRHTFNTLGLLRHSPADMRFLMGHRSEKETDHYNHPDRQLLIHKALKIKEEK